MSASPQQILMMNRAPLVLIAPNTEARGNEFSDMTINLAETYQQAVFEAGGVPLILPGVTSRELIAECVRRADGVLLTGGDDVNPKLYAKKLAPKILKKAIVAPGDRDLRELILIDEVFRQKKPLMGICRGHQIINVALGGTLIVDIDLQVPGALNHRRMDRKNEKVHEVRLTEGSMLASITGRRTLNVNSTHHQAVEKLSKLFKATATSADGVVEGMELGASYAHLLPFFVTVQFHPERLANRHPEHQALFGSFVRACLKNRKS